MFVGPNECKLRGYRVRGEAPHPGSPLERRVRPHTKDEWRHWNEANAPPSRAARNDATMDEANVNSYEGTTGISYTGAPWRRDQRIGTLQRPVKIVERRRGPRQRPWPPPPEPTAGNESLIVPCLTKNMGPKTDGKDGVNHPKGQFLSSGETEENQRGGFPKKAPKRFCKWTQSRRSVCSIRFATRSD